MADLLSIRIPVVFVLLFGVVRLGQSAHAQHTKQSLRLVDREVARIQQKCVEIDALKKNCIGRAYAKHDEFSLDLQYQGKFENGILRKIDGCKLFRRPGEDDHVCIEMYFDGGRLLLAHRTVWLITGVNNTDKKKSEEWFYFADKRLIRWLDTNHQQKEVTSVEAEHATRDLFLLRHEVVAELSKIKE